MAKSPLLLAIFVVFVAGGAVGGGTAALLMRAQATGPSQQDHDPPPSDQPPAQPTHSLPQPSQRPSHAAAIRERAPTVDTPTHDTLTAIAVLEADGDPGTGAWLADSLAQLEQKYQAMMQRADDSAPETDGAETDAAEATLSVDAVRPEEPRTTPDAIALNEAALDQAAPVGQQAMPDTDQHEVAQGYVAHTDVTQNNISTTNVTQVNQTVLMGYVPLLVPVPTAVGQTNSGAGQIAPPSPVVPWRGLSPWAPIDMSRHNNPWKSSRFP